MAGYERNRGSDALAVSDKVVLNPWRVTAAFVLAPFFAALAFAVYEPAYDGLSSYAERVLRSAVIYYVVGALLPTAVLAIPAFLVLKKMLRPTALNCALAGAMIAAIPWFLLGLYPLTESASIGNQPTVIDGEYTSFGWLSLFRDFLLPIAVAGALGGAIFWLIAATKLPHKSN